MLNFIMLNFIILSVFMYSVNYANCYYGKRHFPECHHAECRGTFCKLQECKFYNIVSGEECCRNLATNFYNYFLFCFNTCSLLYVSTRSFGTFWRRRNGQKRAACARCIQVITIGVKKNKKHLEMPNTHTHTQR
jgi:hypothetical protein